MYENKIDIETELMPVKAATIVSASNSILSKTVRTNRVISCKGRHITEDIPLPWANFIADAMNKYFEEKFGARDKEGKLVASLVIPGEARMKEDSRTVRIMDNGRYAIHNTMIYSRWITYAKKGLNHAWSQKPHKLPLQGRYNVMCIFYVKPKKRPVPLPDLCAGIVDCLHKIGVISGTGATSVASMDGCRILTTSIDPRTEVFIREYKEIE